MSQPFVSTPRKSSKEKANPKNIGIEIDFSDVIIDDVPLSIVDVHTTPMRKAKASSSRKSKPTKVSTSSTPSITVINMNDPEPPTGVNKPMSMTILYLDPISIEPNIGLNEDCSTVTNLMENVEAFGTSNKPRFIIALSKSSMIIADKDDVDKNIRVLISQVLGIDYKTNVMPDVSTSLAQPDNNTENPRDNPDVHAPTLSPEKSQDK